MNEATISSILSFLSAHDWGTVKEAFKRLNRDHVHESLEYRITARQKMAELGWSIHVGPIPEGFEWTRIANTVFVRDPSISVQDPTHVTVRGEKSAPRRKTDTSVKRVDALKCPRCGGEMFKEPICPACDEGKRGKKVRLLCGECDFTLAL